METKEYRIKFGEMGSHIMARVYGEIYFKRILAHLEADVTAVVVFDFESVDTISSKFATACFAPLVEKYGCTVLKQRIRYENITDYVLGNIQQAIADMFMIQSGQPPMLPLED